MRKWRRTVFRYALAVALVAIAHVIVTLTLPFIGPALTCVFLAAIIIASLSGGRGPGLLATTLAALDLDYRFTRPYYSFSFVFDDFLWLLAFLAAALLTSWLQSRRRNAEDSLRDAHRNLEEQVRARTAELVQSQEQFALLVNGVPDQAVFILDSAGNIASWNAGAQRLTGYSAERMIGRRISRLWPRFASGGLPRAFDLASLAGSRQEDQGWVRRADGSRFWGTILLTRIHDNEEPRGGYAVSLRDITERHSLEREIVEISEREQQRIGHDLHDGLGQELTGIAMLSTSLAGELGQNGASEARQAEKVADLIHQTIRHTRELARGLCPVNLEDEGLVAALRMLAQSVSQLPGVECTFETDAVGAVDSIVASHLYRIAQEAINNALRHGKAHHIEMRFISSNGCTISVKDDGVGMPPNPPESGMGLRLMEYRAKAIRGSIRIRPADGGGTVVECSVDPSNGAS